MYVHHKVCFDHCTYCKSLCVYIHVHDIALCVWVVCAKATNTIVHVRHYADVARNTTMI